MTADHRASLDAFYDAEMRYVAAGGAQGGASFDEMAAHLHPDVVLHQGPSVPFPGDWVGAEGVERFFATFSATWASLDLTEVTYFVGERGVAISMRMRAEAKATGRLLDTSVGQFILFEGGLIRDFTVFYLDPLTTTAVTLP